MYYKCVVCTSTFCSDDAIYSLQCGHVFHGHCLQQLQAHSSPRCPLCRCDCTTGVRRLFFGMSLNSSYDNDSLAIMDNLRNEVKEKTEIIECLEKEIATITFDFNKQIKTLETKLKNVENTNINLQRDLKIAKEKENQTQK